MNILVFSWRDPKHPLAGGAEQVMHEHMKGWIAGGHAVTLFSSRFKNSSKEEYLNGVKIVRGGYQYLGVQFAGFVYYLKNKTNFNLIVDQFHGIPFFTPLYVRKPVLAVIQEPAREVWWTNPLRFPINKIVGFIGYFGEPFLFLIFYRNTIFMTGSFSAKEELIKLGVKRNHINIIPHGVLVTNLKKKYVKEKKFTVTFLGMISKDKGADEAIKCFSILKTKGVFNFWVIGRPETQDYYNKMLRLVDECSLRKDIKFWGFVDQDKKFELLARSHVLINPSIREGWGLVNIEANSVGTPVVAYRSPGLVDSVKNDISGVITGTKTPESLANNIIKLLKDKERYEKLVVGSKRWSQNYSWNSSCKKSLKLIESFIKFRCQRTHR
ncbi:glycosyltransferase family 4 protein [Candidatus Woesebacteria bacterium]|nr:glycosyltransferase family 4 protein [Candidatus Woesebacteria bacterium]